MTFPVTRFQFLINPLGKLLVQAIVDLVQFCLIKIQQGETTNRVYHILYDYVKKRGYCGAVIDLAIMKGHLMNPII